jgi:cyclopropane-fatty-acyl-phospholipid synthase
VIDHSTLKARIRRELPPPVFKPCPARAVTAIGLSVGISSVSFVLATSPLPAVASLCLSSLCGCMYGSLFFLGHEAGHGSIVRKRCLQDALMWLAFSIFLLSPTLWRVWHNKVHHVYANREDYDPDNFGDLSSYWAFRSVRIVAALTPGSGRWISLFYLPTWFTAHAQIVLWRQSRRCRGFESLDRRRAVAETLTMTGFWIGVAALVGFWPTIWLIGLPMLIANTIIMAYIATNHLLRPLGDDADPLDSSMSLTTHPVMDLIHFNFSHHVEHHLFPSMSPRYAPLVRAKLYRYATDRFLAPSHRTALVMVFRTPRIHEDHETLLDPRTRRRVALAEVSKVLSAATPAPPFIIHGGERMSLKSRLDQALRQGRDVSFTVEYWDGDRVLYGDSPPEFAVRLSDEAVVKCVLGDVLVRFPEAYVSGDVEVEGDLQRLLQLCYRINERMLRVSPARKLALRVAALRRRNSPAGARANVSHHYDLGNEFFKEWLDEGMSYSGAYFEGASDDLETAQRRKLRHICAKLRLERGHRVLDIGCGWGTLALHMASEHDVRATGITLSAEQQSLCRSRTEENGLGGRVDVRLQDYRDLGGEKFDRVVSVGMIEHVGESYLDTYMMKVAGCLDHGGIGVFQVMGKSRPGPVTPWITKHIFPGMHLPTLGELSNAMARAELRIHDVENLRPHYALTLEAWIERFEKKAGAIETMFDARFVRMWRMYLHSACAAFKLGELNLWQIAFTRGFSGAVPLTRHYMYSEPRPQGSN